MPRHTVFCPKAIRQYPLFIPNADDMCANRSHSDQRGEQGTRHA